MPDFPVGRWAVNGEGRLGKTLTVTRGRPPEYAGVGLDGRAWSTSPGTTFVSDADSARLDKLTGRG